jgi:autotransporter-associated beta strand protein
VLTLNGGNGSGSGRTVSFDLNGFDQTIAGLANTTGLTLRSQRIFNTGGQAATLSIHNTANHSFSGNLNGTALSLDKSGPGTQTLAGSNAHTGITSVSEGILALGHTLALQNSALETAASITGDAANGLRTTVTTLTLGGLLGDKNLASLFTTASGGYSGLTSLTLNPGASDTHEYTGSITNGAAGMSLVKAGPGTQILAGANSYTGDTLLTAGTLTLGATNVLPNTTNLTIGNATLNAGTFTHTLATLDVTGSATLNLGTQAQLAFSDSSAIDWTGGALDLTGTLIPGGPGASLRFGTTSSGLTDDQLLKITAAGFTAFDLDEDGYLIATAVTSYSAWQSANGTTQEQDLDHDHDGVPNGIEHFLGGTTDTTGFTPLPGVVPTAGTLSVTWIRHATYTGSYGTDFVVETSATLDGPWTAEAADPDPGFTVTFPSASEVRFTFPPGSRNFARLKVMP